MARRRGSLHAPRLRGRLEPRGHGVAVSLPRIAGRGRWARRRGSRGETTGDARRPRGRRHARGRPGRAKRIKAGWSGLVAERLSLSSRRTKLLEMGVIGAVGFVALQLFPAGKLGVPVGDIGTNPPERSTVDAPSDVLAVL